LSGHKYGAKPHPARPTPSCNTSSSSVTIASGLLQRKGSSELRWDLGPFFLWEAMWGRSSSGRLSRIYSTLRYEMAGCRSKCQLAGTESLCTDPGGRAKSHFELLLTFDPHRDAAVDGAPEIVHLDLPTCSVKRYFRYPGNLAAGLVDITPRPPPESPKAG
jgi:hypothetical protein